MNDPKSARGDARGCPALRGDATRLNLVALHERHRALTPAIAGTYQEAAAVCLSRHHVPLIQVLLSDNGRESNAELDWTPPDARVRDAWANTIDATEAGAYGCVIAGVEELRGLVALRRAETGTGADYYLGLPGTGQDDLEDCIRLEVSGVDAGDDREVSRRLLQKVQQANEGRSSLPAVAGVIGFAAKILLLRDTRAAV
jgi:hypothetical protein